MADREPQKLQIAGRGRPSSEPAGWDQGEDGLDFDCADQGGGGGEEQLEEEPPQDIWPSQWRQ